MNENIINILRFMINNQPNGLTTAEFTLVAAVETGVVTFPNEANEIAELVGLSLRWEYTDATGYVECGAAVPSPNGGMPKAEWEIALDNASDDDEPLSPEEEQAVKEGLAQLHSDGVQLRNHVHCEECNDPDYIPPSPAALKALEAGIESAKTGVRITRTDMSDIFGDDDIPF